MEQTTSEGLRIVLLKGNIQDQTVSIIKAPIEKQLMINCSILLMPYSECSCCGLGR